MFWTNIIDGICANCPLFEDLEDPMDLNGDENNVQYKQHYDGCNKSSTINTTMVHQVVGPKRSRSNHNNNNNNDNRKIDPHQLDSQLSSMMKVRRKLLVRQRLKLIQRQKRCSRNIMLLLALYILVGLSNSPGKILSQQMAGCCAGASNARNTVKDNGQPDQNNENNEYNPGRSSASPAPPPSSSSSSSSFYDSYRSSLNPALLFPYSSSSTLPWSMINNSDHHDGYKKPKQQQSNNGQKRWINRYNDPNDHDNDDVFGDFGSFSSSSTMPMFDEYNFDYQWTSVSSVVNTPTDIYQEDLTNRLHFPLVPATPNLNKAMNSNNNEQTGEATVATTLNGIKVTPVVLIVENLTIGSSANSGTMGTTSPSPLLIGLNSTDEELRIKLMNRLKNLTLLDVFIVIVGGSLSISTILGNVLVMVAFKIDRNLQTISNYFLLSLAVADFLIGCISMPLSLIYIVARGWPLGPIACDIWLAIDYLNSNASVLNLLLISFDRYLSVTRPLTYRAKRTTRRACIFIAFAWIISALLWPPWIFAWPSIEGRRTVPTYQCYIPFLESNIWVTTITAIMAFWLPVTLMCVLYWLIWRETENRYRELTSLVVISPATTTQAATTTSNRSATGNNNNNNNNETTTNIGPIKKNAKKMIKKSRSIDKQRKQTSSVKSRINQPNHLPNCPHSIRKQLLQEQRQQQPKQPVQPQGQIVRMLVGFPFSSKTKSLTQKQELEMTPSSRSVGATAMAGTSGLTDRTGKLATSSGGRTSSSTGEQTPKIFSTHDYGGEVGIEEAHQMTSSITADVGAGEVICLTSPTLQQSRFSIQIGEHDEPNPNEKGTADEAIVIEPNVSIERPQSVYSRFRNLFCKQSPHPPKTSEGLESSKKASIVEETDAHETEQPAPSSALIQNPECPGCEYRLKRLRAKKRKRLQLQKQHSHQSRDSDKAANKQARKISRQTTQEEQQGCSKHGKHVNYQIHELESSNQDNKSDTQSIYTIVIKLDNPTAADKDSEQPSTSKITTTTTAEVESSIKGDEKIDDIQPIDDGGDDQQPQDYSDVESVMDYCMDSDNDDFGDSDEDFDGELDLDSNDSDDEDSDDDSESIKIKNCCPFLKCCIKTNEQSDQAQTANASNNADGQGEANIGENRQQRPQSTSASTTANVSSSSAFTRVRATIQPKSERKAAKTLSAILLAFIVTWTPYNVLVFVKTFSPGSVDSDGLWWQFAYYLCYINSTLNPLLYALCNANFRRTYIRILTCKFRRGNHPTPASATAAAVHHARRREQLRERERNEQRQQQQQQQQQRSTTTDNDNSATGPKNHQHRHQQPTGQPTQETTSSTVQIEPQIASTTTAASTMVTPTIATTSTSTANLDKQDIVNENP